MTAYKCTYMEVNKERGSATFGYLVERVRRFDTFPEAVQFSRAMSNTTINMVGKPIIEEIDE